MAAISGIDGASLKTCLCRVIEGVNSDPTAAAVLKAQGVWDDLKVLRRRWKSPRANTYSKTTAVIMCSNMSPEVKRCWKAYMNRILKFSNTAEHVVRAYTVAEFLVTDLFDDVWSSITNPMEKAYIHEWAMDAGSPLYNPTAYVLGKSVALIRDMPAPDPVLGNLPHRKLIMFVYTLPKDRRTGLSATILSYLKTMGVNLLCIASNDASDALFCSLSFTQEKFDAWSYRCDHAKKEKPLDCPKNGKKKNNSS